MSWGVNRRSPAHEYVALESTHCSPRISCRALTAWFEERVARVHANGLGSVPDCNEAVFSQRFRPKIHSQRGSLSHKSMRDTTGTFGHVFYELGNATGAHTEVEGPIQLVPGAPRCLS